ncbi:MAG: M56 family metallopeptidase [Sphingobacteriales bacterium]|nr:M56 family metallopeptidase [Sphingobacteriales bacterium]
MITGQTSFLQSLGWAVFSSLWQMALLWIIYQFIIVIFKSSKASFKSSLATILLVAGFGWFLYTFAYAWLGGTETERGTAITAVLNINEKSAGWFQSALGIASVIYLILLILPALQFIRNYRYVQVIRRYGLEKMDAQWKVFVQKVAAQMDIRKKVKIWASEFVTSPVTVGFLKPVILVPLAAISQLTPQQMEAVLLHELSHIRRYDYLLNLIISLIKAILYFNPFVKAFAGVIEREREKSCDEMVLQFQYDSHEYASALLTLEKTANNRTAFFIAASGKRNDLLHRVELIMGVQQKKYFGVTRLAGLLAAFFCIFSLNALLHIDKTTSGFRAGSFNYYSPVFVSGAENRSVPGKKIVADFARPAVEKENAISSEALVAELDDPDFKNAAFTPVAIPGLKKYEEEQVKKAIETSRKVFENEEWKALEKNIAEVLTLKEKEQLKATYKNEINKLDWNQWEHKLRMAYDKVDWNRINEQLAHAVNNIRLDSLQKVYNDAICKLDKAKEELLTAELKQSFVPEVTVKVLDESKRQLRKTLNSLKASRNKKIVHL